MLTAAIIISRYFNIIYLFKFKKTRRTTSISSEAQTIMEWTNRKESSVLITMRKRENVQNSKNITKPQKITFTPFEV